MDMICFILRILTIVFAVQYHLPSADVEYTKSVYFKAFAAGLVLLLKISDISGLYLCVLGAATNALRLYQRLQGVAIPRMSQQFLQAAMAEDSAHYLLYCVTFPMSTPVASK